MLNEEYERIFQRIFQGRLRPWVIIKTPNGTSLHSATFKFRYTSEDSDEEEYVIRRMIEEGCRVVENQEGFDNYIAEINEWFFQKLWNNPKRSWVLFKVPGDYLTLDHGANVYVDEDDYTQDYITKRMIEEGCLIIETQDELDKYLKEKS